MPFDGNEVAYQTDEITGVLIRARELIERGWCQRVAARRQDGEACSEENPLAAEFCIIGSLAKVRLGLFIDNLGDTSILIAMNHYCGGSIAHWNDKPGRTKEEVLRLFDDMIAART